MTAFRRAASWTALAVWAACVWAVSSRSDPHRDIPLPFDVPDKVAHGAEFAVGGLLARDAFSSVRRLRSPALAAVIACAIWGFADEIHQGFVPGRTTDPRDLAADVTGAALGVLVHASLARRTPAPAP
jgi:VanZ family protein